MKELRRLWARKAASGRSSNTYFRQYASLQQQLAALHAQMEALNQEAVDELKLKISDTKKLLRGHELQLEELTGKTTKKSSGKR